MSSNGTIKCGDVIAEVKVQLGEWNGINYSAGLGKAQKWLLDAVEEILQHSMVRSRFDPSDVIFGNALEQLAFTTGKSFAPSTIWNRVPGISLLNADKDTYQLVDGAKDKESGLSPWCLKSH